MNIHFSNNIVILGCGSIAQCALPMLLKHLPVKPQQISVIDFVDNRDRVSTALEQGVSYHLHKITPDNLASTLSQHAKMGDIIIDLAWNIDCVEIVDWCHQHGVMYINTSVEEWDPYTDHHLRHPTTRTLYHRHMQLRKHMQNWQSNHSPTAILEHGANPGLVSHFIKIALRDISTALLSTGKTDISKPLLERALADADFAKLAYLTGTKVIHISERDTQIVNQPKKQNEFVNTWSAEGLYEEGIAPAEMGWGTHEKRLPQNAFSHQIGPRNQICLGQMGIHTKVRSWVPSGEIIGMVIRHGEAFTISEYLSLADNEEIYYRPTVHYAYCPSDMAIASLYELAMHNYKKPLHERIVSDEVIDGQDELGVLLMGHGLDSWWTGSILDIHTARQLVPGQNATTVQVAAAVLSAVQWMMKNPEAGVKVPDDLPYEEILHYAKPFLGKIVSKHSSWTPTKHRRQLFANYGDKVLNRDDPWQFENFLISD
ncbi:MAG: saccharopine dehydrogenase C-terminal domain-containing protein [Gammaproteobacteria bacterium]